MGTPLLAIDHLSVTIETDERCFTAVRDFSLQIRRGEIVGLVGESGSGKSVACLSIVDLTPKPLVHRSQGRILFQGEETAPQALRGKEIAFVFQEPMTALNPVRTLRSQFEEIFLLADPNMAASSIDDRIGALMQAVGIPDGLQKVKEYPHRLSGGLRQRMMIAMALACKAKLLIADEPTTALDVTIQAQILDLLRKFRDEEGLSLLLVSHDLGVIAETCDRVVVMYAGEAVEEAPVEFIFSQPLHPYTRALLQALPRLDSKPKSKLLSIPGQVPKLWELPQGCAFAARCSFADARCKQEKPLLRQVTEDHKARCHHAEKLAR